MAEADVPFDACYHEDRGDGAIFVLPVTVSMSIMAGPFLGRLRAELRRHNELSNELGAIRLRVALHAGEVRMDEHGLVGAAVIHVFRLLDAQVFKDALARSGAALAVIASDRLYEDVLRHGWDLVDPADYTAVDVRSKETSARAWILVPGGASPADASPPEDAKPERAKPEPGAGVRNVITGGTFQAPIIQAGRVGRVTFGAEPREDT